MHRCIRCGKMYTDVDQQLLQGCGCGSKFFLFLRSSQDATAVAKIESKLRGKRTTLEKEIVRKLRLRKVKPTRKPARAAFGIETVRIPYEGVYRINIDALMRRRPLIILERSGVYFIHLPSVFERPGR